jgi:hypothetical protein
MSWALEVAELNRRKELAAQMGGEQGVAKQRQRGKLIAVPGLPSVMIGRSPKPTHCMRSHLPT